MEDNKEKPVKQEIIRNSSGRWVKGQSGNLKGRPKGKTMKEWAKDYLSRMTDEERDAFMEGIPKDKVWAMAEGNPETKSDLTSGGQPITVKTILYGDNSSSQLPT